MVNQFLTSSPCMQKIRAMGPLLLEKEVAIEAMGELVRSSRNRHSGLFTVFVRAKIEDEMGKNQR